MTPADLARDNAISFECKKDTLRQNQSGDWKIAFTVQGLDMDERLTKAFPGTRYMAVLVEISADELPVHQPKEVMPNPQQPQQFDARPLSAPKSAGAKREKMDWRELQPAAQAGIRCADPVFRTFMFEEGHSVLLHTSVDAAEAVREFCGVDSRTELCTNHKARVLWTQLDSEFQAWQRVGA